MRYGIHKDAKRRAFQAEAETCPKLEILLVEWQDANNDLIPPCLYTPLTELFEQFRDSGTIPLREALVAVYAELIEAENRISDLESEVSRLGQKVEA